MNCFLCILVMLSFFQLKLDSPSNWKQELYYSSIHFILVLFIVNIFCPIYEGLYISVHNNSTPAYLLHESTQRIFEKAFRKWNNSHVEVEIIFNNMKW